MRNVLGQLDARQVVDELIELADKEDPGAALI